MVAVDDLGDHLRLLADGTRLRLLHLLDAEPLTVAELQDILGLGQSSISGHLAKLKQSGLIHDVAEGASRRYRLRLDVTSHLAAAWAAVRGLSSDDFQTRADRDRLAELRQANATGWVDRVAGSLDREYAPGRTWAALCQGLLSFARFGRCIDVGAGDGSMAELLAPRCDHLTCVDPSPAMVEAANGRIAALKLGNVTVLAAGGEAVPLPDACADSVLFLQSLQYIPEPAAALREASRLLAPGGRLLVLTLVAHDQAEAERFGHRHRGFTPRQLAGWARGLTDLRCEPLPAEPRPPHFQSLVLTAGKPS